MRQACVQPFSSVIGHHLWRISILLTALFLPWYNTGLSIAQILMGVAALWPSGLRQRLRILFRAPVAFLWPGTYTLLGLSLLHSENQGSGIQMLRTFIPLFSFPLAMAMFGGISRRLFRWATLVFLISVATAVGYDFMSDTLSQNASSDHRAFSRTVSHLRMGYFLTWAAFLSVGARLNGWISPVFSTIYLAVTAFALVWFKSLGMIPFILVIILLWIWWLRPLKVGLKPFLWVGVPLSILFCYVGWESYQAWHFYHLRPDSTRLRHTLQLQAPYAHLDQGELSENGVPVLIGLNEPSLERGWRTRSSMNYWGTDLKGQQLRVTLWRYLASCGYWTKDSAAVAGLSLHDVRAVEKGITNRLMKSPWRLAGRIYEALWEWNRYQVDRNPRGRSLATRLELWKAAWNVVKDHPLRGVGLGDVRGALAEALDSQHSRLLYLQTYGPHNQWLGLAMAGGIPLLLWVVLSIFLPIICAPCSWIPSSAFFLGALLLGCGLWEDVWETQASMTFFSYFFWLSILCKSEVDSVDNL